MILIILMWNHFTYRNMGPESDSPDITRIKNIILAVVPLQFRQIPLPVSQRLTEIVEALFQITSWNTLTSRNAPGTKMYGDAFSRDFNNGMRLQVRIAKENIKAGRATDDDHACIANASANGKENGKLGNSNTITQPQTDQANAAPNSEEAKQLKAKLHLHRRTRTRKATGKL